MAPLTPDVKNGEAVEMETVEMEAVQMEAVQMNELTPPVSPDVGAGLQEAARAEEDISDDVDMEEFIEKEKQKEQKQKEQREREVVIEDLDEEEEQAAGSREQEAGSREEEQPAGSTEQEAGSMEEGQEEEEEDESVKKFKKMIGCNVKYHKLGLTKSEKEDLYQLFMTNPFAASDTLMWMIEDQEKEEEAASKRGMAARPSEQVQAIARESVIAAGGSSEEAEAQAQALGELSTHSSPPLPVLSSTPVDSANPSVHSSSIDLPPQTPPTEAELPVNRVEEDDDVIFIKEVGTCERMDDDSVLITYELIVIDSDDEVEQIKTEK